MDHATSSALLLATHFATSLFPLTVRLIPVITQIGRLIVRFRKSELTPHKCKFISSSGVRLCFGFEDST